jgi:hypothetical protein
MNTVRRALAALGAAFSLPLRAVAQGLNPDHAGKQLREMVLAMQAKDLGLSSSPEYPRLFGVVMDWPVGDETATVVAISDGTASLYTTSTFGIIGGQAHASVRAAGKKFIENAERYYDESALATSHPYPPKDKIAFYLLCYDGVRLVSADLSSTQAGASRHATLFSAGQEVLTQLRKTILPK